MPFVGIDTWTIIMQWGNLFILIFLMKKFLFRPVAKILEDREREIKDQYNAAASAQNEADTLKSEYTKRLNNAQTEAEEMVKQAAKSAKLHSESILNDAQAKAEILLVRADEKIQAERKSVLNQEKNEISDMAVSIAGKIIEKDLSAADHTAMIEKFITELGEIS